MMRVSTLAGGLALSLAGAGAAYAHHGWTTYAEAESEVSGVVESAELGAPHGLLRVRNAQGTWNVMLSPPAGIQRAGLTLQAIPKGAKVVARGHMRTDGTLEIKTERLVVGAKTYDLYPNRN
jgi:hypothetical protein